jgi:Ca2+-binding EF-hand superfamily protein
MEIDQEKVKKLFMKYDTNKNQTLEKHEFIKGFKELLNELGENFPDKKNEQVAMEGIAQFDLNGNGCIEYDEFEKLIQFLVEEKGYVLK